MKHTGIKPGKPPQRKTEMPRGEELKRKAAKKPKRRRNTSPLPDVKQLIRDRNDDWCEVGIKCAGQAVGVDPAHRQGKKTGGTRKPWSNLASNLLWACRRCHNEIDDVSPADAERHGFKVAEGVARPWEMPVKHYEHGWVLLDDEGGHRAAPSAAWDRGQEPLLPVVAVEESAVPGNVVLPKATLTRFGHHECPGYEWDENHVVSCTCGSVDLFVAEVAP